MRSPIVIAGAFILGLAGLAVEGGAQTFKGYSCTVDCSGHQAGYDWAEENGITDESDCDGNSNSFNEGCQTWVEEQGEGESDNQEDEPREENEE